MTIRSMFCNSGKEKDLGDGFFSFGAICASADLAGLSRE